MKRFFMISHLSLCLAGCAHHYNAKNPTTKAILPSDAENIVDMGNNWLTFELTTHGKRRCFLYHKAADGFADISYGFEAVTELENCKM